MVIYLDQVIYFDEQPWIDAVQKFNDFRERELASGLDDGFVDRLDDAMKCIDKIISLNELVNSFGETSNIKVSAGIAIIRAAT